MRQVNKVPGISTRVPGLPWLRNAATFGQIGPCKIGEMYQAVEVMHGALEVGQHRAHFVTAVTQVFCHHLVSVADTVYKTVIIALNLL